MIGLGLGILAFLLVAGVAAGRRAMLWRAGRPAPLPLAGLLALPRRYLRDVHAVVARQKAAAQMHVLVAGGTLAAAALALGGLAFGAHPAYDGLTALAFAVQSAGTVAVARRRIPVRPRQLSQGAFLGLPLLLGGFGLGGFVVAADAAFGSSWLFWPGLALFLFGGFGLAAQVMRGPMRHAVAGAVHLAAHPRPARFAGRSTALLPLDLEAETLGVETAADFAWNRLAGFDACIQCGRCEQACPAFAAGQPLNPKRLIQDLAAALDPAGELAAYAGSPYPNARPVTGACGPAQPIVGAVIHADTLWSCTTCRACVDACPMMIEHVDAVIDLRRFQVLEAGAPPPKAAQALSELRLADDAGARPLAARGDFAAGLALPVLAPGDETEVLLWLGEGAFDLRYGRSLRALLRLLQKAGVTYGVLGADEKDCGDLARRLGDEATFQRLAEANIAALKARRFSRIVTADPHALQVLRNEYPAFGGTFTVQHHSEQLAELLAAGKLAPHRLDTRVTYHDPCYLGRYNGITEAPRDLLGRLGVELVEMERHGLQSFCCGGGGGAALADIAGDSRIPDLRMAEARATGAAVLAVACPGCTAMLEGVTGANPEVRDLAELLLAAVEAP
ncbi:DUF3483 domain-containing protein [Zavarzinia sp.]|uniref:DUF3483 domain-containing protein n=1 Tax=Zavarzinia sp. TaxID=2027920 RepID=UPI003561930E